ncbi:hypothetical protein [Mesobacterium pallidum]|uniref:hypothetical protein n=1 Tax=Mesobacterium pallidum TaxID=2872037 RepID=UPI001EE2E9AD|nr:hypothetical protein [Mesobacterium pallidum]
MLYSWFTPWWGADIAVLPGKDDLVMRPWGIEVKGQVRANANPSMWAMPWYFTYFMWGYLAVCMLMLAASLFVTRRISIGRFSIPVATLLILFVGLSYMFAMAMAYGIGTLRAEAAGSVFVGESTVKHQMSGQKIKMVSELRDGFWFSVYAGAVLTVLGLVRFLFVRSPKA